MKRLLAALFFLATIPFAHAQDALVVSACGTVPVSYTNPGAVLPLTVDTTGKLCSVAGGGGGTPGGSNTQLQYNNAGAFGGISGATSNGTTVTFAASDLILGGIASTQCLQANSSGVVSGTGAVCGTATAAGASPQVAFFSGASSVIGDASFTFTAPGQATLALGTITTNLKALTITGTWNAAGVTFDAPLFMNVTNTASASGSLLMDLEVGGATKAAINSSGVFLGPDLAAGNNPNFGLVTQTNTGLAISQSANKGSFVFAGSEAGGINSNGLYFSNATAILWSVQGQTINTGGSGAKPLVLYNGANAMGWHVYNTIDTFPTPTNYERAVFDWTTTANTLTIGTQAGGTGSPRNVAISTNRHVSIVGGTPTANTCAGFALATGSSDATGAVTYTSATTCSINFGSAYTNAPFCQITPGSAASTVEVTTTTAVLSATFGTAQTAFSYHCFGA